MKYRYTGSGIMTFYDSEGKAYTVSAEKREVDVDEEINVAGIELIDEKFTLGKSKLGKAKLKKESD